MNPKNELGAKRTPIITALLAEDPGIPARTAARILHAEHPELFASVNIARQAVQLRTGCHGAEDRRKMLSGHGSTYREPFTGDALPAPTPFWDSTPFVFDSPLTGIMADVHIPFHEPDAIKIAVDYMLKRGVKDLLLLGDVLDHYQVSEFSRVPEEATLTQELRDGKQFFEWLRRRFKGKIVRKEGNHEERFVIKKHKAMTELGTMMDDLASVQMGLADMDIETVTGGRMVKLGYLHCLHGHELGRGTTVPVSPARSALLKARECTLVAHWHQKTEQRGRTITDRQEVAFSIGCMCNLHPHYAPINNWQLGFAICERTSEDGGFVLDNKVIIGKRVV